MRKFLLLLLLFPLSFSVRAETYGSGWYRQVEAGFGYEDNISRSFLGSDRVSDESAYLSFGGGYSMKHGARAQVVFSGYVGLTAQNEYDDLNRIAIALAIDYTWQPNLGYDAPWFRFRVEAIDLSYRDSDAREGLLGRFDASVNRRLTTLTTGRIGYRYDDLMFIGKSDREENLDAAFDTATHEVYLGIDHEWLNRRFVYAEYSFRHGGTWSNQSFSAGVVKYNAETIDTVFDDCAPNNLRCQPRYAGRIVSDTHSLLVGVSFPFNAVNVDFSGRYYRAEGENDRTYKDWYLSAGLIWNF